MADTDPDDVMSVDSHRMTHQQLGAHQAELGKHRKRLDELERDHWTWLGVDDERAQARRDLLWWALLCIGCAAYLMARAYMVDRAPAPGGAS